MTLVIKDHEKLREKIRDYYRATNLWLPDHPSQRIYRFQCIGDDGSLYFHKLNDRITSKKKLRKHLIEKTPINAYFSVSSWLNPSNTGPKTYKQENGNRHITKNGFLYSDAVVDMDHTDKQEVRRGYKYLINREEISEDQLYIVFSGGGYHLNIVDWYRNKEIENPIEREKDFAKKIQALAQALIDSGIKFDYIEQGGKINSPTTDTRRVRKLPNTITKYGNKAEKLSIEELEDFTPTQVFNQRRIIDTTVNIKEHLERVKQIG